MVDVTTISAPEITGHAVISRVTWLYLETRRFLYEEKWEYRELIPIKYFSPCDPAPDNASDFVSQPRVWLIIRAAPVPKYTRSKMGLLL